MSKLKPCPSCGGEAIVRMAQGRHSGEYWCWVECQKCGNSTPDRKGENAKAEVIEIWNAD